MSAGGDYLEAPLSLEALRRRCAELRLYEHAADGTTVPMWSYPSAVSVTLRRSAKPLQPTGRFTVGVGVEAVFACEPGICALGFDYQQGLFESTFEVALASGEMRSYRGVRFYPDLEFFGVFAAGGIRSLRLAPNATGTLELHRLVFFARREHDRVLTASRPESLAPATRQKNWSWQCLRCGGYSPFTGTPPVYLYCGHCGTGRIVSEEEYLQYGVN
jgi:hypothetical protein